MLVTIIILALLCLGFYFYGPTNHLQVRINLLETNKIREELVHCKTESERLQKIAEINAEEAKRQHQRAEEAWRKTRK